MKGTSSSISTGTGSLAGIAMFTGSSAGSSIATGWFPQTVSISGTGAGSSIAVQVTRTEIELPSAITLISEYASAI